VEVHDCLYILTKQTSLKEVFLCSGKRQKHPFRSSHFWGISPHSQASHLCSSPHPEPPEAQACNTRKPEHSFPSIRDSHCRRVILPITAPSSPTIHFHYIHYIVKVGPLAQAELPSLSLFLYNTNNHTQLFSQIHNGNYRLHSPRRERLRHRHRL